MANEYFLLFKTAQSENRCWSNFHHPKKNQIVPIIELTRGRKKPKAGKGIPEEQWPSTPGIFDYKKNIAGATENFSSSLTAIVDVTREPSLSCAELSDITVSRNGYSVWRDFCADLRDSGLPNIIPTILVNPSDIETPDEYKQNIIFQFESIIGSFGNAAYRASILHDTEFLYDLILLAPNINAHTSNGRRFLLIIDHEFIRTGMGMLHALRTSQLIQKVREIIPRAEIIVLSTSFPSNVTEIGGAEEGMFRTEETYLYEEIIRQINDNSGIYYGDYGSISPTRNDLVFARGGWRPRIDFTTNDRRIFYYREKREDATYAAHYASVAANVANDPKFSKIPNSWGVKQILEAAAGRVPSSSPSFWISVRMEIFLQQQVGRLLL